VTGLGSSRGRRPAFLVLVCLACLLGGCASDRLNLRPLYYREVEPVPVALGKGEQTNVDVLYPFFSLERSPSRHYHALRPLYNLESRPEEGYFRVQYLWPFGLQYSQEGETWQHRFWPLFNHSVKWRLISGEKVTSGVLFPFFWWGSRPPQGAYFAVFPLGGVLRGVLGDRFTFLLFPLASVYHKGDYRRYDLLWPFISFGGSPDGRRRVLRLWPLFVYQYRQDRYRRHYLLWPFIRWGSERKGRYVHRYVGVFPFYAGKTAYDPDGRVVAYQRQYLLVTRRWDSRPEHRRQGWSFLLSLLRYESTPQKEELRFLPFFWRQAWYARSDREPGPTRTRYILLWPLLWLDSDDLDDTVSKRNVAMAPFYWQYSRTYPLQEGRIERARSITLWPLATYERERDGSLHFWVLSHGWKDIPEGYKRNYRAFFDLFQYHRWSDHERETRLLWRLYHHKRGPAGRYLSLGPLFTYDSRSEKKGFWFLSGLLGYERVRGKGRLRLLYIPIGQL